MFEDRMFASITRTRDVIELIDGSAPIRDAMFRIARRTHAHLASAVPQVGGARHSPEHQPDRSICPSGPRT
jgi:hypothetical protein